MGLRESIAELDAAISNIETDVAALGGVENINTYISQILLSKSSHMKQIGRLYAERETLRVLGDVNTELTGVRRSLKDVPTERVETVA